MTIWTKIGILAIYTIFIFALSWHVHTKFDDADKVKEITKEIDNAHKAENNIIKFNSDLGKVNDKDSCFNTLVPNSINILLK